jgi:hypothetical protein
VFIELQREAERVAFIPRWLIVAYGNAYDIQARVLLILLNCRVRGTEMEKRLSFIKVNPHSFGVFTSRVIELKVLNPLHDRSTNLFSRKGHIRVVNYRHNCRLRLHKFCLINLIEQIDSFLVFFEVK